MFASLVALIVILGISIAICFINEVEIIPWILLLCVLIAIGSLVYYVLTSEDFRTEVVPTLFGTEKLKCKFCTARFLEEQEVKDHEDTCVHRLNREGDVEQKVDIHYEAPDENKPSYLRDQNKAFAEEQKWRMEEDPSNNGSPRSNVSGTSPRYNMEMDPAAQEYEAAAPILV